MQARLNPASPARYPRFWEDYRRGLTGRDYPLGLQVTEPFSLLRDWMGLRRLSLACRTERAWVEEMVAYLGGFFHQAASQAVTDLGLDFAIIRAPWAYRAAAAGGADTYSRLMRPFYREVAGFLRAAGIGAIIVLARGQVGDLVPFWLECGVNALGFLEVAAGLDAPTLRARYGRDLALIGNLDSAALACQWRDIADEVQGKVPALLAQGGYFPAVDRPMPSDVPLENYEYYLALLRRLGGDSTSVADIEEAVRTGVLAGAG
jgi:uroporphyrinogen decarboxylase